MRLDAPGSATLATTVVRAFEAARADVRARSTRLGGLDSLIGAIQGATLGLTPLGEALEVLGRKGVSSQGADSDGACDAMYAMALAELWTWTGDRARVAPFVEAALSGLRRMDATGDLDGDGFYEGPTGGILDAEGRPAEGPVARCRTQGYAFLGKVRLAQVLVCLGRMEEARRLAHEANELQKRFIDAFWMRDEGYLAVGLDGRKRPIRSIASDAGSLSGRRDRAYTALKRGLAERLRAPDLCSGWGVRSLAADPPAYDP